MRSIAKKQEEMEEKNYQSQKADRGLLWSVFRDSSLCQSSSLGTVPFGDSPFNSSIVWEMS
jgi:hypothetical protein